MGEPIGRRSMRLDQEERYRGGLIQRCLNKAQAGEPNAGCQLSPRVHHGGTHRSTLGVAGPGRPVSVSSWCRMSVTTWLGRASSGVWRSESEIPSYGETHQVSPCRPPRAPLRCNPDRRSSRTAPCRSFILPYIPSPRGGGSCASRSAVSGGTHVSSSSGSTPPNAAVGKLRRSAYVRLASSRPYFGEHEFAVLNFHSFGRFSKFPRKQCLRIK